MNKLLLFFILISFFTKIKCQVVFCPPGAVWHYNFFWLKWGPVNQSIYYNEEVKYVRDSIIDSQPVKVLKHNRFFTGNCAATHAKLTLIKQVGDTIFMRNLNSQHSWQILYNFAALPGHSWQNTFDGNLNYNVVVDSVSTVTINNFNLKRLYVKYSSPIDVASIPATITERLGTDRYIFNFKTSSECDGPSQYNRNLCYTDNTFGLKQFSSVPCDYSTLLYTGIKEEFNSGIRAFPNPASDVLSLEITGNVSNDVEFVLIDLQGRELIKTAINEKNKINLTELNKGLYFFTITQNKKPILKEKLIKE